MWRYSHSSATLSSTALIQKELSGSVLSRLSRSKIWLSNVPIILKVNWKEFPLYALLDYGSEISVITSNLLNLRGRVERVSTITINGETKSLHLKDRQLYRISSTDCRFSFNISDVHVMKTFELSKGSINLESQHCSPLVYVPVYSTAQEELTLFSWGFWTGKFGIFVTTSLSWWCKGGFKWED
jgi:hypothetical protein